MIQVEPIGNVSIIRLDRAEKKNALTPAMLRALTGAMDRAISAHAVVVSGVGDVFCAGFDLSLCRDDVAVLADLLSELSRAVRAMRQAPCPVVVSAHGAAIAGGCALLGGADVVITDAGARLGYPVVRLGISPAVTVPFLRLAVGDGGCRARVLDPGLISGLDAVRIGLAHECAATAAECEARAIEVAKGLAAKPRHALAMTKRWLGEIDGLLDSRWAEAGLEASLAVVGSAEQRERLAELWKKPEKQG